jgi:hypothetical protein
LSDYPRNVYVDHGRHLYRVCFLTASLSHFFIIRQRGAPGSLRRGERGDVGPTIKPEGRNGQAILQIALKEIAR